MVDAAPPKDYLLQCGIYSGVEMLDRAQRYESAYQGFRWSIPAEFNVAVACCDRWAADEPNRTALLRYAPGAALLPISYGELSRLSDRLALALRLRGIQRGDRVAILLPQSAETVVAHLAAYKLAAIAVPLAALFGPDALRYRLQTAGTKAIVTDADGVAKLAEIRADLPELATVLCSDGPSGFAEGLREAMAAQAGVTFTVEPTGPDDPALMIFTSGTTGQPKGALHGHRVLLGHLPGISFTHAPFPEPGARVWTPSDWAWAGGLLNALLPSLYHGVPVVFGPFRPFEPEAAFAVMAEAEVRHAFLPPTALKMMRSVTAPRQRFDLKLRSIGSAGESLGREAFGWSRTVLGVTANEFYGQTECNYVIGSAEAAGVSRAGAIGKPIPGHRVAVIDAGGGEAPVETLGQIAIRRPDPVMFLGYWNDPAATAAKFIGEWMTTGDQGIRDRDGYIRFVGRDDDVITSAGYRIGPAEIEDCLIGHPAVALAAVVGKPDRLRTEIVKAFVLLKPGHAASEALAADIRRHVRTRLSAAEYPREVAFVDEIPLTTTGKVIRRLFRERVVAEASMDLAG
jgi:acetyl-CoA synthetase